MRRYIYFVCIYFVGGPGAAHEAEQFIWNDHVVIPVRRTGGAAGGKFNVPEKIFQVKFWSCVTVLLYWYCSCLLDI